MINQTKLYTITQPYMGGYTVNHWNVPLKWNSGMEYWNDYLGQVPHRNHCYHQ